MLSKKLLTELRHYYQACRPQTYLFPSTYKKNKNKPLSYETVRSIYEKARKKVGVKNGRWYSHPEAQLRHASVGGRVRHP